MILHQLFLFPNGAHWPGQAGPDWKQQQKSHPGLPQWTAGPQALGPYSIDFPGALAGCWCKGKAE